MLSSTKHKINLDAFSNSSSSSSPSSTSTSTSSSLGQNSAQVTMEEVWKEINLGSLHHHRQLNIGHELKNQNPDSSIFQYFLNMPLNQEPPPPSSSSIVTALYNSPLPLPLATVVSLNSGVGFEFLDKRDSLVATNPQSNEESARSGSLGKKRGQDSDESRGARRHKRMIKNRESAARSRARKQEYAYTNELELEIAHLQRENARLKRQQELVMDNNQYSVLETNLKLEEATQQQVKKTLQRSSTAPF